jgi:hypothetical protein
LGGSQWSAEEVFWAADGSSLTLRLRRNPGDVPSVAIRVDLDRRTAPIEGRDETPLAPLSLTLDADYRRRDGKAPHFE